MLLIGSGWTLLAAFDLWLILVRPNAAWDTKISFLLALVGIYTFAFEFGSKSGLFSWSPGLDTYLTSPNPALLLAGVMTVLGVLFAALGLALRPTRSRQSLDRRGRTILYFLQTLVLFAAVLILVPFTAVYLLLVAPLAWIAYAIVDAPLDSIRGGGGDTVIAVTGSRIGERTISVKQLVDDHLVTLPNTLVAVPALVSSVILSAHNFV